MSSLVPVEDTEIRVCIQPTRRRHECVRSLLEGGVDTRHECRHAPTGVTERTSLSSAWVECTRGTSFPPPELNWTRVTVTVTSVVSAVTRRVWLQRRSSRMNVRSSGRDAVLSGIAVKYVDDAGTQLQKQLSRMRASTRRRRDDARSSTTQKSGREATLWKVVCELL